MKRIAALIGLAAVSSLSFAAPVAASSVCPVDPTAEAAPGVDWSGCDLSGAYLSGADLTGANLSGANLTGALAHARYLFADLSFANLTSADLSGAEFALTNITYVTLTGANLSIARIEFSSFFGATGEPLTDAGAFYNQVTCPDGTIASFDLPQMSCWAPPDGTMTVCLTQMTCAQAR